MKPAANGWIDGRRRIARKNDAPARMFTRRIDKWHRADEGLCVGMQWLLQNRSRLAKFDDFAEVHHRDSVGYVFHDREIMRNEEDRQLHLVPDLGE